MFERGMGVMGLSIKNPRYIDGEICTTKWVFFIRFVMFISNYVVFELSLLHI